MNINEINNNKGKIVNFILSKIVKVGFDEFTFGLRKDDEDYSIDQTPRNSNHWYDFDWDNATALDGTCATNIDLSLCCDDEIEKMKEIISEAFELNKAYTGINWYLLYGTTYNYDEGQDENEIIMKDAKVLSKITL